jgi:hypothetical protein
MIASAWQGIALATLRGFRPFHDGTPAHDHLGDIFATLEAAAFQQCFVAWVSALTKTPTEVIATDGKTLRRCYRKEGLERADHGFRFRRAPAPRARTGRGGGEIQRDRRDSQ